MPLPLVDHALARSSTLRILPHARGALVTVALSAQRDMQLPNSALYGSDRLIWLTVRRFLRPSLQSKESKIDWVQAKREMLSFAGVSRPLRWRWQSTVARTSERSARLRRALKNANCDLAWRMCRVVTWSTLNVACLDMSSQPAT